MSQATKHTGEDGFDLLIRESLISIASAEVLLFDIWWIVAIEY